MPHAALKLVPGVDVNRTPALNEAAISVSQLIRFVPDDRGIGLVQKLGGWTKYFGGKIGSVVRALWAWVDVNDISYLGVGAESELAVISSNTITDITPRNAVDNVTVDCTTIINTPTITIKDTGSNITAYDSVFIETQISVGGLILFGMYPCIAVDANDYQIVAVDIFGNPLNATASISNGGAVPTFTTTINSSIVTVTLTGHGLAVGNTFPVLVSTTVATIVIFGNYTVATVVDANNFTIQTATSASAGAGPTAMNSGNARYNYYIGIGPLAAGTGYGVAGYGTGGYGSGITPAANPGTAITATDWTLDNWGSIFLACPREGAIYTWDPTISSPIATVIPQAPTANIGMFVAMPERMIIAYGSTTNGIVDDLLVRWCDIANFYQWIGLPTNQAGQYRLTRGSRIVGGIQAPQQCLLWTDVGLWSQQYINQPYIWSFNEIGIGCGLIGQKAMGILSGVVFWMGRAQFYMLGAGGVETIYCPIWDVIFQDIDLTNAQKIRCAPNSMFSEISWYYPTTTSNGEVAKFVKYNTFLKVWDFGTLVRTAWINQSALGNPIGADANSYIYQHETSPNADGQPMSSSFITGYAAMSEADIKVFVDQVWPDMKWGYYGGTMNANISLTFYVTDYPGQTPITYGPYALTQGTTFITPRFRARLMSIGIASNDIDSFWRIGNIRYRFAPDGKF